MEGPMPVTDFSKWSPGGNTTLFFPADGRPPEEQAALARLALAPQMLGGEQAGFVDISGRRLRMAGGEFCLNASLAFGALLAMEDDGRPERSFDVNVSGWPCPLRLTVRGRAPRWHVEAGLPLPPCPVTRIDEDMRLVRLPGIAHVLLHRKRHPVPENGETALALLRQRHGLADEACVGGIWWKEENGWLDMLPIVHVRDTGTTCFENACGSGALALALALAPLEAMPRRSIRQPGGATLGVTLSRDGERRTATVDCPVTLVARGQFWHTEAVPDPAD